MAYEQVQKPSSSFVPVQKKVSGFAPPASRVQAKEVTAGEQEQMPKVSTPATDANWLMKHPLFKGNQFLQRVVAPASESESLESEESLAQRETVQRQEVGKESGSPYSLPVQAKLTIGEPGDKYEQEADRVASQVVKQINSPDAAQSTQGQSVQRQEEPEEELQRQPSISDLQRSPLPLEVQREAMSEEDDLQAKSILQRREAIAGGEASTDLDTAINSARGGGQPLDAGLQRSMGQAMGADFSGVKVHTDAQSDQLNQSIQAKAFTTGQDVFFRQGAYEPASRGGQELIAHELTHVVQQTGDRVQKSAELVQLAPLITPQDFTQKVPGRDPAAPNLTPQQQKKEQELARREVRIRDRLLAYNQIADDNTQYQQRLKILNELDRAIYEWFAHLGTDDFDKEPLVKPMQELMEQSDAEHVTIVDAIKGTNELPVDVTGMDDPTQTALDQLWQSVVNQTGALKIENGGDAQFLNQTLSGIAKMLQAPAGRKVVEYLNAAPANPGVAPQGIDATRLPAGFTGYETIISPNTGSLRNQGFATAQDKPNEGSANKPISQVLNGGDSGETTYKKMNPAPVSTANYAPVENAVELNAAITQGKEGYSITQNDNDNTKNYHKFGSGQGSSTVMQYDQFARSLGRNNEEVITPKFVLLAHELGHALRVKGGASGQDNLFQDFGENNDKWMNRAEELLNVEGIENPIRQEHGISERGSYKTWKVVHGKPLIDNITIQCIQVVNQIRAAGFTTADVMAFVRNNAAFKTPCLMAGSFSTGLPLNDTERREGTNLKDQISKPLYDSAINAIDTLYNAFMRSQFGLLTTYLRRISSDATKAGSLAAALDEPTKIQALAYLHTNQAQFKPIKELLHLGSADRVRTNPQQRESIRINVFRYLIAGHSVAQARQERSRLLANVA